MLKSHIKITCHPYDGNSRTKAFIDLTLDDTLVIKGFTLIEWGDNNLFLAFPSKKGSDDNFHNTTYFLDKEYKKLLEDACIKKYNEVVNKSDSSDENFFS